MNLKLKQKVLCGALLVTMLCFFSWLFLFSPIKRESPLLYHAFWQKGFGRKQAFSIKSLLVTQDGVQKRPKRVMLWLESDFEPDTRNVWVQQMRRLGVDVKKYNAKIEASGTPLKGCKVVDQKYQLPSLHSDWARFVILYKHGGLYFDLDTVFLKDVGPLVREYGDFAYRWVSRPGTINNAFLHMAKGGSTIKDLVERAAKEGKATGLHGFTGFMTKTKPSTLNLVPDNLIDFCWCDNVLCPGYNFEWLFRPLEPGSKQALRAMDGLEKSFVYHWHNCWKRTIEPGSLFETMEKKFDAQLGVPFNEGKSTY